MVVVSMVAVTTALGAVVLAVCDAAIIGTAVVVEVSAIGVIADAEIIAVGVSVIVLKFSLPDSYSLDVSSAEFPVSTPLGEFSR